MNLIGCVATHNDIDLLPGCIKSLADMDRIIVVDGATAGEPGDECASTDGTAEYLTKLGEEDKRVAFIPCRERWADKIAKRNRYLVGMNGDWYFMLEAFERAYGVSEIKWFVGNREIDVYSIQYFPQPWAEEPILVQRLFRHMPGIRYEGTSDRVVCDEKVLVDPATPAAYLTDQDPLIAPRIVSVIHKRLKAKSASSEAQI